jgi:hypothetical protein
MPEFATLEFVASSGATRWARSNIPCFCKPHGLAAYVMAAAQGGCGRTCSFLLGVVILPGGGGDDYALDGSLGVLVSDDLDPQGA